MVADMAMKHFHNTIDAVNPELSVYEGKCKDQDRTILAFFEKYPTQEYTPFEVQESLRLYRTPITSIRRSMTNLTKSNHLIKTGHMAMGIYGKPNFRWRYNFKTTLF